MPEGGGLAQIIHDEPFHQLTLGEIPIEDIHFGLIDTAQTL